MQFGEWPDITGKYRKLRRRNRDAEEERAGFLAALAQQKPWLRRSTFAKDATFETMKTKTWQQIVEQELHEDFREVSHTLAAFEAFPKHAIATHGRDVLVSLWLRLATRPTVKRAEDKAHGLRLLTEWAAAHGAPPSQTTAKRIFNTLWPPRKKGVTEHPEIKALQAQNKALRLENRALRNIVNRCGICAPRATRVPVAGA